MFAADRRRKINRDTARAEREDFEPIDTTIRAIRALGDLLRSADTTCEELAIDAALAGKPAFWTSATYHNQAAVRFAQLANSMRLEQALADRAMPDIIAASEGELLASLIPLNPKARDALFAARLCLRARAMRNGPGQCKAPAVVPDDIVRA
ncbi:MAG TPA: hypothetical protein VFB45_10850 [Pseudolabrys sp.]|nr:hypothetical protein [Pseudolabrys sp.]